MRRSVPSVRMNRRAAFTLIEAMMATVVLSFCVAGLAGVLVSTAKNGQMSTSQTGALEVARADMETLTANPLSTISGATGSSTETVAASKLSTTTLPVTHTGKISYISRSLVQPSRDLAVITVTTTTADGEIVTLKRLVTRAGASQ
ncbi:MAG: prepilin-type N-terminal cleavage/methylation domain-containing protein [Burkholderiales bacterium]|nr:prepilin-type N-terminal cleavage/methylation domain-containing protein [Phycisphaerae bacterium]